MIPFMKSFIDQGQLGPDFEARPSTVYPAVVSGRARGMGGPGTGARLGGGFSQAWQCLVPCHLCSIVSNSVTWPHLSRKRSLAVCPGGEGDVGSVRREHCP